jgi:PAS domain S-box-containing protein
VIKTKQKTLINSEHKRLTALNSYDVLDTLPEKEYDAITRLASYICQAPVALITLVDADRQWFKSQAGVDGDQIQIPRNDGFCQYTILNDGILEINDVFQDERFKDNVLVKEYNLRFYAGAPLIDPNGQRLGSLCVLDMVPRKLTVEQRDALRTLADQVMSHLVLRKQKKELEVSLAIHQDFYNLFNSSSDIHFVADADSNIELINNAVTTLLGYDAKQAIGRSLWDFVVGKNREQFVPLIEKGLETHRSFELETQTLTLDNEVKWISWSAINKGGKWYASGRDISYHKKILADLEQLSLVASRMTNGVVISDANDKIVWTNEAFTKITGYVQEDVERKRLRDVIIEEIEGNPTIEEYNELIASKQSYQLDILARCEDGRKKWLSLVNSVVYDKKGGIDRYIRILVDINTRKRTEKDLEILSFAARKSPTGMVIRDNEGNITWLNEAVENILGYKIAELRGKKIATMLPGEETDLEVYNSAVKAVQEKKSYDIELKVYKKDRTPIWVAISNSPLFDEAGNVQRQIGTMIDITARKKAEEELKMLSLVASNTTSGVVINDSSGRVEWVNSAFEKITGYTIEDLQHEHLGDVLKGELTDVSIIEKARELSKNKQSFEVDVLVYRKDGKLLWISVINSAIINNKGEVDKYIEVIIDITAKKKVELELITAKEEALQLNRAKDMFISVMSHEIRTPLNAVIGMSNLLLEDNPKESQKEHLSVLKFSSENLMTLINDVLDFTKIETGNVELEKAEVNLRELIQGVANSMQYCAAEKNIFIKYDIDGAVPKLVIGDAARLVQILLNLVSNAVKFTEKGGVSIDIKALEESDKSVRVRFAVTDTGIGIAKNKLNAIFESFKQAEPDITRKYGGTGLGLAISKRLIELHDSRINVDSVQGQGSTFWFTITFNKADIKLGRNISKMEIGLHINVLVVDDNQINRLLINKVLKKWGADVDFAENGAEAVEKIETNKNYDVVLMDIHMPLMDGLEATQIIRAKTEPYFQNLPIIALTASMLSSEINSINSAGMNDYILKPFEPKMLYDKLSRYQKQ